MRQFYWKIFLCLFPVLVALGAIYYAWEHDRFKLGVDLSGGTILVYEIDTRKQKTDDKSARQSPHEQANLLAESLKRRIDPNDLKNIVIRTAGEGRVEIILPTGGVARAEKAEKEWEALLREMEGKYKIDKLDIPRGQERALAERIQQIVGERTWNQKLFGPKDWDNLSKEEKAEYPGSKKEWDKLSEKDKAKYVLKALEKRALAVSEDDDFLRPLAEQHAEDVVDFKRRAAGTAQVMVPAIVGSFAANPFLGTPMALAAVGKPMVLKAPLPKTLQPYTATNLRELMNEVKERVNDYAKEKAIDFWFKEQAWKQMISALFERYPQLKERKEQFFGRVEFDDKVQKWVRKGGIQPDSFQELIGRVVVKGDSLAQAFVSTLEPLLGSDIITPTGPNEKDKFLDRKEVAKFVEEYYGPSLESIEKTIEDSNKAAGRSRDIGVEAIQDVKDKVAKVGSLEFRILANDFDEGANGNKAIEEAKDLINKKAGKPKLEEWQVKGLPPVGPTRNGQSDGEPKAYELTTLQRGKSIVTYSWVELGPQERQQLGLNNAARTEPGRGDNWFKMKSAREQGTPATQLDIPLDAKNRKQLGGALFFSRVCEDRNLPEEERRKKQIEYFVLTRNPEIDEKTGKETPRVDGTYLTSAAPNREGGQQGVSFTFDATGGELFGNLTRKNVPSGHSNEIKRHLAIILDGLVVSAPTINSEIRQHGQITGSFTAREVDLLVNILRSGALPATLKQQPVSEGTIPATLGAETIVSGVRAVGIAFLAIIIFMIFYYRFAGLVASVALTANLILTVGFMVAVQATFTLPGLAGLVLMLGMAVDANVLIYIGPPQWLRSRVPDHHRHAPE